jgi:NAD(P)-dependent dehydrogenase (short-subunit alcohol dehydrogenase family)
MTSAALPLLGKVAVVTGASRGIGRAIARRLSDAGADLALLARNRAALDEVAEEILARGGKSTLPVPADVSDPSAIVDAAARVHAELGAIDILVNNAGEVLRKPFADITDEEWRLIMAVNLDGAFHCTRAFADDLIARRGRVINIASIAGRRGTAMLTAYCAAKHGLVGLTRALAEEFRDHGVAVNAICPGSVDTSMLRRGLPDAEPLMTPDDVAATCLFLAAAAPPALTGSCVDVFG